MSRKVANFIRYYLAVDPNWQGKSGIEIEAKLGVLVAKDTGDPNVVPGSRFTIPHIISAAILEQGESRDLPFVFQSSMTDAQHKAFNLHLNREVEKSNSRPRTRHALAYKHTYQTDTQYERPRRTSGSHGGGPGGDDRYEKIRITHDDRTKSVVACVSKQSIAQLNITHPDMPFDVRISINYEEPKQAPPQTDLDRPVSAGGPGWKMSSVRKKDRMTYTHQAVQIDLTQVTTGQGGRVNELEVECCNMADWSRQAVADVDGRQNRFDDLVGQFCSTVNKLNQVAAEAGQQ